MPLWMQFIILASIIQLNLHYWPSRAPFIRDKEWDNPLLHAKAGWADWVAQHCQTKHSTGNTLEPLRTWQDWDGEWLRRVWGGPFRAGREPRHFFFLKRDIPPLFQGRMKYPLRLVTLGILFRLSSFFCDAKAEQRNLGWGGFKPRWERTKSPPKDFFYCLLKNKYL